MPLLNRHGHSGMQQDIGISTFLLSFPLRRDFRGSINFLRGRDLCERRLLPNRDEVRAPYLF